MKSTLHHHHVHSKRSLQILLTVNMWYYLSGMLFASTMLVFQLDEVRMRGYCDCELYADWARLLYLLADAAVFVPIVLYIFFNTKNINFKDWMVDVMIGYRMLNNYCNCSIFIRLNCRKSTSYHLIIDSDSSILSTESIPNEIENDYEYTDDYMKNYKSQYLGLNYKSLDSTFQ